MNPTLFICTECENDYCTSSGTNRTCVNGGGFKAKSKPVTNADRIRAMTDEELAEWVWGAESAGRAYGPRGKNAWLNWLTSQVEEGET